MTPAQLLERYLESTDTPETRAKQLTERAARLIADRET